MDGRALLLVGAIAAAALAAASCSGPNPAAITFENRDNEPPVPSTSSTGGNNNNNNGGDNTGGNNTGTDGGGGTGTPADFFGGTTFKYVAPTIQANTVSDHGASNPVAGKNCIQDGCHLTNNHKWVFAGTVYTASDGKTPVTKAEVRVNGPDGTAIGSAYTDDGGNFWLSGNGQLVNGSKVGVRTESGASAFMSTALMATDKGCNAPTGNCHGTAAQGKVHVP